MVLTTQDFLIKAGLLIAATAISSLQWSLALYPDGEALFHLGSLLAFVISVPIIALVPGALFFGVAALTMDQRTRDHTRACFLMGLYVVALLMVGFNVMKIADIPRSPFAARGDIFFWYIAYFYAFIYSLPGVDLTQTQQEIDQKERRQQQNAQRPGTNRWLFLGRASLLVFTGVFLVFWWAADLNFALKLGSILGGVTAVIAGVAMLLNDALHGRLRFWRIVFPDFVRGKTRGSPPSHLKRLGRYDIEAVLGKGAMGVLYAGNDTRLKRKVAIKTILKAVLDEDASRKFTIQFAREAEAVARLNHPNIVQMYDFGEEGDIAYIVMEFIKGRELKDFFDAKERFELRETVHIMCELCDALHFAHKAGVIHRDIKPRNVMIDFSGSVKLADFGVARITDVFRNASEKTQASIVVGTPVYMSPEQIEGGAIDRRADIFSAGVVLYQFLTGEKPFTGTDTWTIVEKVLHYDPPRPSSINNAISPLFDAVVNKALAKKVEDRYQTANELGIALKNALEGKGERERRAREQRTRDSGSNSGHTGGRRGPNSIHFDHYYRILEVAPGATINEVKAAYRRRMQEYHPDKVASLGKELRDLAEAKSKEITGAYRAIMDTQPRP